MRSNVEFRPSGGLEASSPGTTGRGAANSDFRSDLRGLSLFHEYNATSGRSSGCLSVYKGGLVGEDRRFGAFSTPSSAAPDMCQSGEAEQRPV